MQTVQTTLLPFNLHRKTVPVPAGLTLQQMVDHVIPHTPKSCHVVITINGEQIDPFFWRAVRPKECAVVGINVVAAGGGGGKNPLGTILSIALLVAAPYIAGWGTAAFITETGSTSLMAARVVYGAIRIGISIIGFVASSMLASTPKQPSSSPDAAESPTQFIEGAGNDILKYGVIPCNLGTNRMFPPQAALPYTETEANKQYVRQLFTYGYGDLIIEERKIGETVIADYTGVTMEDRLNSDLDSGTAIYANDILQDGLSVLLSFAAGYIIRTTQADADEASLDITFLAGLTRYGESGNKLPTTVTFEIQYTATGGSDWSTGALGKYFIASSVVAPNPPLQSNPLVPYQSNRHILVIDIPSGVPRILTYSDGDALPIIPDGMVRLASFNTTVLTSSPYTTQIDNFVDDRAANIPSIIADSGSFVPSHTGMTVNITDGTFSGYILTVTEATAQAARVSRRFTFPARGTYDVRIKRLTADATTTRTLDVATYTALRTITHRNPVNQTDISGTGMRILATDQLNGSVDRYNVKVTSKILDYFEATDNWLVGPSSNPASIYRYVLQSPAFVKRLDDDQIDLDKLAEWHSYCVLKKLTYNRVIDYETDIDSVLDDIAAAGMATPHKVDGIYGVIIDNERPDLKGMVNPRNCYGYSGNINYPEIPHALRVEFRNKDKGYLTDECIVFADGYDATNATLYERLSFLSCTNSDLAFFYGRTYLAVVLLQPETHKFNMDWENLTFNRGDRITFVNDSILVGVGQGRIKTVIEKPGDATKLIGFTLDDTVSIPSTSEFAVRIRHADASGFIYYLLTTVVGETKTFTFAAEVAYYAMADADKWIGSLCSFVEDGEELDLIITDITGNSDQSAAVTATPYAPARFSAASGAIPPFVSNITVPLDLLAPVAPILAGIIQSDESVMSKNGDGTYEGRMIIPLLNKNEASVMPLIRFRRTTATEWSAPNILSSNANSVVLTGLDDGAHYDIEIRYQRPGGRNLISPALQINNQIYIGASSIPDDVTGFVVSSVNSLGLFQWTKNAEIDIDYYEIRFSKLTAAATWENSQIVADVKDTRITLVMQSGTYSLKAFDILGNESVNATQIISFDNGAFNNVVEFEQEQTAFLGTKDNVHVISDKLFLEDPSLGTGIYYFQNTVDLGDVYTSVLSASVVAYGENYTRVRAFASIRARSSIRASSTIPMRSIADIRSLSSVRGIDPTAWSIMLQMRTTNDDPGGSPVWSAWTDFILGNRVFRAIQFRLIMNSFDPGISPRVDTLEVTVDMPDRHESAQNVSCPVGGVTITYVPPFKNNPAVNITVQDGAVDDRIEYISKTNTGFTIKVYNATLAGYVSRTFDYESSGYGRTL